MRHVVFRHVFGLHESLRPLNQINAIHPRHLVVNDDQSYLVLIFLVIELLNSLGDGAAIVVEACLAL